MTDIHRDKKIDNLIGRQVRIVWFDGEVTEGYLSKYDHGYYYILSYQGESFRFRKSHIKKISRI